MLDPAIEVKYEVLAAMGEGGMGTVYKVRHRHLDEIRVVKLMRDTFRANETLTARFLREAKTAVKLRHPNIAEVMDYDVTSDGTAFIVMEYIEGLDLREVARRAGGRLDWEFVVGAALQTLSALSYLHGKGFIHRDISPDNLMLTRQSGQSTVKLIDLGIAKSVDSTSNLTIDGHFVGKVRYASPEQFSGDALDFRSDLYSLGVALYELLTGAAPITGSDYKAVIAGHLTRPPRDFAETDPQGRVPTALRNAILKALAKDPRDRYDSAAAFAEHLASIALAAKPAVEPDAPIVAASESERATQIVSDLPALLIERSTVTHTAFSTADDPVPPNPAPTTDHAPDDRTTPALLLRRTRTIRRTALAAVLGIAIVAIPIAVMVEWKPAGTARVDPAVSAQLPVAANILAAAPTGELVLNGLPWAEVVQVTRADGKQHAIERPLYTPAVLTLEPGTYRVLFSHPVSGKSATVLAEVKSGESLLCEARLDDVDAETWLREALP